MAQKVNFVQTREHEEGDLHAEAVAKNIAQIDARNKRMEEERLEAARVAEERAEAARVALARAAEEQRAAAAKAAEERAAAVKAAEEQAAATKAGGAKGKEASSSEDAMVISDDEGPEDSETEGEGAGAAGGPPTAPTKAASSQPGAQASSQVAAVTKVSFRCRPGLDSLSPLPLFSANGARR